MRFFRAVAISVVFASLTACFGATAKEPSQDETPAVFRYHIPHEPQSLDPSKLTSTDASYFFNNIMRGLYSYSDEHGLIAEEADSCVLESKLKLVCKLRPSKWSDGSTVTAADYVRSFRRLVSSNSRAPTIELLKNVKNAMRINAGALAADRLGVRAESKTRLVFDFSAPDPDFLFKLTHSVLVPVAHETYPPPGELKTVLFNGPYRVVSWSRGRRFRLEKNPFYERGHPSRPPVEVLFIDDDQTALNLYEQKQLSFLRRLPPASIATFQSRPDFFQIPVARFDYIGFGDALRDQPDLRAALSYGADYAELRKALGLQALGPPGCPGLAPTLIEGSHCVPFDIEKAKTHLARVPPKIRAKRLKLMFSKLGGDDVKRAMEWFQANWKKNLGLQIDLEQAEQQSYLQFLRASPPPIFRKGVGLERPTCLAALETFARNGAENFLKLDDSEFEKIITRLTEVTQPANKTGAVSRPSLESRRLCGQGVQYLVDRHWLIPLGRMVFTMLVEPRFVGWSMNEMNQLDLAHLSVRAATP